MNDMRPMVNMGQSGMNIGQQCVPTSNLTQHQQTTIHGGLQRISEQLERLWAMGEDLHSKLKPVLSPVNSVPTSATVATDAPPFASDLALTQNEFSKKLDAITNRFADVHVRVDL